MFKLFSRSKPDAGKADFSFLGTDVHSHLIPGIDDGSPDMATSLTLIKGLAGLGYSKIITTPHIMQDMYPNSRDGILSKLERLQQVVKEEGIQVEVQAAAEYFLDDHMEDLLRNNEPLLTISGNMVLVEFSLAHAPMSLKDLLFELQMKGYQPVIAHPERYIYLADSKEFYEELKETGCFFQLNLLALSGYYGKSVHDLATYLVKKGYYDLIGTDMHHQRHLAALSSPAIRAAAFRLAESGKIRNKDL